ncbi:hypothetical protein [Sporosarcina koreensis]|uniref:hypothetical protein n=1 Tax=Sporosarcina koreensis TaxID=334735 RepID=UPI00058C8524|nr:hypothetical protein [Sporosarcina koreensis]
MSNQVNQLFNEILDENKQAVEQIGTYDHPLLILLKQSLQDQQSALRDLLPEFEATEQPQLSSFKNPCTHVYHANEVSMPFYESWKRAIGWMPDPSREIEKDLSRLMENMHHHLLEAAQQLESEYGTQSVKYVIPTFYLPVTQ